MCDNVVNAMYIHVPIIMRYIMGLLSQLMMVFKKKNSYTHQIIPFNPRSKTPPARLGMAATGAKRPHLRPIESHAVLKRGIPHVSKR
jgi:hypothetical protein